MNNDEIDAAINSWKVEIIKSGVCTCPCGFIGWVRNIRQHRNECGIWNIMLEKSGLTYDKFLQTISTKKQNALVKADGFLSVGKVKASCNKRIQRKKKRDIEIASADIIKPVFFRG